MPETTLAVPAEFFGNGPLQPDALKQRYGLSDLQIGALESLRPFKAEWAALTATSFSSRDKAAGAIYALVERTFERTPAVRESMEIGGEIYRKDDGSWHLSLPTLSSTRRSILIGSKVNTGSPVTDTLYFWHTHATALPENRHAAGFSFEDR